MSNESPKSLAEVEVDRDNLYREEMVTDLKVASIRILVPIKADGSDDASRDRLFTGETHLMSQAGPVPVQCPIDASTLEEAMDRFPEAVNAAIERLMAEAKEMQQREASRIVVPGRELGGKIQLP